MKYKNIRKKDLIGIVFKESYSHYKHEIYQPKAGLLDVRRIGGNKRNYGYYTVASINDNFRDGSWRIVSNPKNETYEIW